MSDLQPGMTDAERLEAIVDELAARLTALPDSSFTYRAGPDEWTAAEVVGHLTEMLPYWAGVATAIANEPGRTFGRALDDPDRAGAVASANQVPRAESLARLRHATHEASHAVRALNTSQWQRSGVHPERGTMTVGRLIEDLMIDHAETHVQQALAAAEAAHAD